MAKKASKKDSWEDVGRTIGKKIEEEFKENNWKCNKWTFKHDREGGFIGRLLFALGVVFALNAFGIFAGLSVWFQIMMVAGFALMRF